MGAEKRQPRGFEPPPWEREQFDELQRRSRGGEGADEAELPGEPTGPSADETATHVAAEPQPVEQEERAASEAGAEAQAGKMEGDEVDEVQMSQLLTGLKSEESGSASFHWLGIAISVGLGLLGAVLMVWGIVALQATQGKGTLGWLGAAGTIFFGVGFIAIAGWAVYKILQRQGVL